MLPDESDIRPLIAHKFGADLSALADVHSLAVAAVYPRISIPPDPDLDPAVHLVALALYVKACKQTRAIWHLCELGLGLDASALVRHLFETTVALAFVLRKRVFLRRGGKRSPPVRGKPLNRRLRARLYLANMAFEQERTLDDWLKTRGLKRHARTKLDPKSIRAHAADAVAAIGPEWTDRLKKSRSYSGLSLRDLVGSLRLKGAYATMYRSTSWSVHGGADLGQFVVDRDGRSELLLSPSDAWVQPSIGAASLLLILCVSHLDDAFRLGLESRIRPHRLRLGFRE